MKYRCVSIVKPEPRAINEDAVMALRDVIAVADGAGGGGMFAERWSRHLLDRLPETPITSFEQLDRWVDGICDTFYAECEAMAKAMGPMVLNKFYDEGSFSTLAAIWICDGRIIWTTYGDSVAFCYNRKSGSLQYSIPHLADFDSPPYLISCIDPSHPEGFSSGNFDLSTECVYFVTSDALAHYILMMYMVAHKEQFSTELESAASSHGKNANIVKAAYALPRVSFRKVIDKLLNCNGHPHNMRLHLEKLHRSHLLALDDYSIAAFFP